MIEVDQLTRSYGALRAVDRISFQVKAGQIVGFLGPNGAGKTTSLRILTGFQPADSGRARVAGCDVFTETRQLRERIGYLPESTPLYPEMRVNEYLRFRARLKRIPRSRVGRQLDAVSAKCHLRDFINRPIAQLSKGMRQRVGLADALIHDPQVVFLDEPTIGLDPTQIRHTRALIAGLAEDHTVMLSSHILADVEAVCSHVIIINHGRVVADGRPAELSHEFSASSNLVAEIQGPADAVVAAVKTLHGVTTVDVATEAGWNRLHIATPSAVDIRADLARLIHERGWALRELRREIAGLEEFFLRVVARQTDGSRP